MLWLGKSIKNRPLLGSGKTAAAVGITFKNWFGRQRKVYSNMPLYGIPYYYAKAVNHLDEAKKGIVLADEMWSICDSRLSITKKNRFTANILLRSRKRELIFVFTAQLLSLLDRRIRGVLDFTSNPILARNERILKLNIFRTGQVRTGTYMSTMYLRTKEIFKLYDTNCEIDMEDHSEEPMEIRFQKQYNEVHGAFCTCNKCGGQVFDSWKEADKAAEIFWNSRFEKEPHLKVL